MSDIDKRLNALERAVNPLPVVWVRVDVQPGDDEQQLIRDALELAGNPIHPIIWITRDMGIEEAGA